jgi:hypothetical protein
MVLSEELLCRKHLNNSTMEKDERLAYISQWKQDHWDLLLDQLGPKDVNVSFLDGIFFSPSFSQGTVPELQRLMMADMCHLNLHTVFMLRRHSKCQHVPGGIRYHLWQ